MSMAMAQPTLELHTQEFVDSLAGALPIYTLSPAGSQSLLGPGTVRPGRQARCAIPNIINTI
jgi:hypothetical protein